MNRLAAMVALAALPLTMGLALADDAEARAGGGSHSSASSHSSSSHSSYSGRSSRSRSSRTGGGGSPGWAALVPFFGLVGFVAYGISKIKQEENARRAEVVTLVPQAARRDPAWEKANLLEQAQDAFMAVQNAWTKQDMRLARHAATDKLYAKHRDQIGEMLSDRRMNVLEAMTIRSATIVRLEDHRDDAQDAVWIKFAAQAIDYTLDTRSGDVVLGDRHRPDFFTEIWIFKRRGDAWLADEILPSDVRVPASFVEA